MVIEKVNESNLCHALEVYKASWRESHRDICSQEFLDNRDYRGYLRTKIGHLYLAYDDGPVGVFSLDGAAFGDLYIHPAKKKKGYGTACVRFAKDRSRLLRLTVLSSNLPAISLYKKEGFLMTGNDLALKNGLRECEMVFENV